MMEPRSDTAHWARAAAEWISWARAPHDVFWAYRPALMQFIGRGTGKVLEVGCGEGRVSRAVRELGFRITATDAVAAMVEAAQQAGSADEYAIADGHKLPFDD